VLETCNARTLDIGQPCIDGGGDIRGKGRVRGGRHTRRRLLRRRTRARKRTTRRREDGQTKVQKQANEGRTLEGRRKGELAAELGELGGRRFGGRAAR